MSSGKNLLLIHHGALGDFVLTFPAILALKSRFTRIDALCPERSGRLAVRLGLVAESHDLDSAFFTIVFFFTKE